MVDQYDDVKLDVDGRIGVITLTSLETRNALSSPMGVSIQRICDEINTHDGIDAVVIRGANGTFCSGADTRSWGASRTDPAGEEGFAMTSDIYSAFVSVMALRVPTIAAVRGAAVGRTNGDRHRGVR